QLLQECSSILLVLPSSFRLERVIFDRQNVIGRGGDITVYQGRSEDRDVIVQEVGVAKKEWNKPLGRKLLCREAIDLSELHHQNILPFLGVYIEEGRSPPITIHQCLDGGLLEEFLIGRLPSQEVFERIVSLKVPIKARTFSPPC
ncbi:hypothetical protein DL93DRAFT_2145405, partial [Clavulina sp. PMI_390]